MATAHRVDQTQAPPKVTSEILDRQPPVDLDAERAVLGSILLDPEACDDVAMILRADDFHDDANRRLYTQMHAIHDAGRKIDLTLLVDALKTSGDFEAIGGTAFLGRISDSVPHAAHAKYYAEIVRNKATYRSLIFASTEILREAYDEAHESSAMLNRAEQKIFSILDGRSSSTVADARTIMNEAMERLDARLTGEHTDDSVETGFTDFDSLTGGLHNSELIILAARPGMGKTALAMNIAEHVVTNRNGPAPVLFVSLEMAAIELANRLLCSVARVDSHRLRNGTISGKDQQQLVETAAQLSEVPLFVDDSPSRTMSEIAAAARRIKRREKRLGLIVIDYLQLIEPDDARDPRQEQVARIARRLKGLAREMEVPVLCLAQLNRQADGKDNIPRLSHLRESGAIEQDADVVMFVHREEYFHKTEDQKQFEGQAQLLVRKQRNGPTGDVPLHWFKQFTRFTSADPPNRHEGFDQFNAAGQHESGGEF